MWARARLILGGTAVALIVGPVGLLGAAPTSAAAPAAQEPDRSLCATHTFLCTDPSSHKDYEGNYVGHDEPAVAFHSQVPGSGNRATYDLTLPRDSASLPKQNGTGGTWNFQLRPAFWFSMVMCDNQSSPEYTHAPCTPDSDTNIFDNPDPSAPDWIGHHPGSAFMEMQFYPPGWVSWPEGISCDASQWCAALNIDSLSYDDPDQLASNLDCLQRVGVEPVNFAFITKSGKAHAPAGPLDIIGNDAFVPKAATDMRMNPGDQITLDMHDTAAGFTVSLDDRTSGTHGSMTASTANGFAQVMFEPTAKKCHEKPYAFHPQFSTSTAHTRAEWPAHNLNVAYSDEIGHFEYCGKVAADGTCAKGGTDPTGDPDDSPCFPAGDSLRVRITGCIGEDDDFDGSSYLDVWPGTGNPAASSSEPVRFGSPTFDGHKYNQVTFETDLLALERSFGYCASEHLEQCRIPVKGSEFYPMFTTGKTATGGCEWREGGTAIPKATNTFGGTPAKFWGQPTQLFYPATPTTTAYFYENFDHVLANNPC